jgi:hypothetical protein
MSIKATTVDALSGRSKQRAGIEEYLDEMALIRKRMKSADSRIRRADSVIRRSLDETWAILRHVQASR